MHAHVTQVAAACSDAPVLREEWPAGFFGATTAQDALELPVEKFDFVNEEQWMAGCRGWLSRGCVRDRTHLLLVYPWRVMEIARGRVSALSRCKSRCDARVLQTTSCLFVRIHAGRLCVRTHASTQSYARFRKGSSPPPLLYPAVTDRSLHILLYVHLAASYLASSCAGRRGTGARVESRDCDCARGQVDALAHTRTLWS